VKKLDEATMPMAMMLMTRWRATLIRVEVAHDPWYSEKLAVREPELLLTSPTRTANVIVRAATRAVLTMAVFRHPRRRKDDPRAILPEWPMADVRLRKGTAHGDRAVLWYK
jgi:hypothetical protein